MSVFVSCEVSDAKTGNGSSSSTAVTLDFVMTIAIPDTADYTLGVDDIDYVQVISGKGEYDKDAYAVDVNEKFTLADGDITIDRTDALNAKVTVSIAKITKESRWFYFEAFKANLGSGEKVCNHYGPVNIIVDTRTNYDVEETLDGIYADLGLNF